MYNMLGIAEQQPILDAALLQAFFHLGRDVDKRSSGGHFEPEILMIAFHYNLILFVNIHGPIAYYGSMAFICISKINFFLQLLSGPKYDSKFLYSTKCFDLYIQ